MRTLFCSVLTLFLLVSDGSHLTIAAQQPAEYQLVFSDEFNQPNGSQPDPAKWVRHEREPNTWARWISPSPKVAYIKNGSLVCRAIPNKSEPSDTARMLTGAVCTKGKFEFQYGKIEVRMKTNLRTGNFPAVWLFQSPTNKDRRYAEIDIVEMFGNDSRSAHTIHTHRSFSLKKEGLKREQKIELDVRKWHVYGLEWDKNKVIWTVDGREVFRYSRSAEKQMQDEGQWTFDRLFYLILNQSVGDGNHPLLVPNTKKTYETRFDWIRVYQKK